MIKKCNFSQEKVLLMGFIGVCLYGLSVVVKRNILNIGLGLMVLASLFFIKKIDLKKLDRIQKLFLILIIVTPIFDILSPGGLESALVSIQKSYRFLPLFLAPIFLTNYDRIRKFMICVNISVLINCFYTLNVYRKFNWNFNIRYETIEGVLDTSQCLVILSYIILGLIILSYEKKDKKILALSTFTYFFTLFIIFISKTRASWLAFIFSMIFFLSIILKRKIVLVVVLLGILVGGIGIFNKEKLKENIYYKRVLSIKDTKAASPRIRLMFWKASYDIYKENWIFGVGKDNSPKYFVDYFEKNKEFVDKNLSTKENKEELFYIAKAGNPHSMYFDNLVNMGLIFFYWAGMMIYTFFFQLKKTLRLKYNKEQKKEFIIRICTLCSTISFAVVGVFGSTWGNFIQRHSFLIGLILFIAINNCKREGK